MKTIGLFEAKTRLSELLAEVAESGEPFVITRRGAPLVRVEAVSKDEGRNLWERRDAWIARKGVWKKAPELPRPLLENPPIWRS